LSEPSPTPQRLAAVIILNWNAGGHLRRCVESVASTVPPGTRVVLVDNASSDASVEAAVRAVPTLEVVRNLTNLGFAGAYNRAIADAPEPYAMLLNPDTVALRAGWLEDALAVAQADPAVAEVACKLVFAHDPSRLNSAGGMAFWFTGPVDLGFGEPSEGPERTRGAPFAASGGAMLVRRDAFLAAGGFDERMFAFVEDVDLGWRLRLDGLKVAYASHVVFQHAFSSTLGPVSPRKFYLTHRNWLRAMLKNYRRSTLAAALPAFAAWTAVKSAGALVSERSLALAVQPLRAVGWNLSVLADTLKERRKVQGTRRVGDAEIRAAMGPRAFEPFASLRLRQRLAHEVAGGGGP